MNSKQRVQNAICHKKTDRPPVYSSLTPQIAEKLARHLGVPLEEPANSLLGSRCSYTKLLQLLGNDLVGVAACYPDDKPVVTTPDGLMINEWGMVFKACGLYTEFHRFPLAQAETVNDILNYHFPDPHAPGRFRLAESVIAEYGSEYGIVGDLETCIFETSWYLVGLEKFLMDLLTEAP